MGIINWEKKQKARFYAIYLAELAYSHYSQGEYSNAENFYQQALSISQKKLGSEHPDTATYLNNLAILYRAQGRLSEAEPLYQQALAIRQKELGPEHPDTATYLNNLAGLYQAQGRLSEAEPLYQQALAICQKKLGPEHPDTATSLDNLAVLYQAQGRLSEAEPLYQQALAIRQKKLGPEHPDTARSLNNLAGLYQAQGRYGEAEPLYQQALAICQKKLGIDHPDTATSLDNLAALYREKGRYGEAEPLHQQALSIRQKKLGIDHPNTATSLDNLAALYRAQGRLSEAEPLYQQALAIRQKKLGIEHPDTARSLDNLAGLYQAQGRYGEAEPLHQQALAISQKELGIEHPDTAVSLNNLAELYQAQGRYGEAEPLHQQALAIRQKELGIEHPNTATSLNNLAALYRAQGRYGEALAEMQAALKVDQNWLDLNFPYANESEKLRYLDQIQYRFIAFLSLIYRHFFPLPPTDPQRQTALESALEITINRKAVTLTTAAALNSALYSGRYPELEPDFQQLRQLQQQRAALYSQPYDEKTQAYKQELLQNLNEEIRALEGKLAQAVPEFKLANQTIDLPTLCDKLGQNSTLLEFVRFRLYDFEAKTWTGARYIALIQSPGKTVEMVDLGDATEIDQLIADFRKDMAEPDLITLRARPSSTSKTLKSPDPKPLQAALLEPLAPYLQTQHLFIVTEGLLHLLPFNTLLDLADGQTLHYLNTSRELLREDFHIHRPASDPLILADPNYDYPDATSIPGKEMSFERIASLRTLGESVATKLGVKADLDNDASSARLTQTVSPRMLLIATHGAYEEEADIASLASFDPLGKNLPQDIPMYRSYLAMTGANTAKRNEPLPPEVGSGLLYAQDIVSLDLWNCDLVVLCACQTGMGDIRAGEGVFGLRRAFGLAGAKTLLLSLWTVPALATTLLMDYFFDVLASQGENKNYPLALQSAQNYVKTISVQDLEKFPLGQEILSELKRSNLLNGQPEQQPLSHPHFWGAWICQGLGGVQLGESKSR